MLKRYAKVKVSYSGTSILQPGSNVPYKKNNNIIKAFFPSKLGMLGMKPNRRKRKPKREGIHCSLTKAKEKFSKIMSLN
jgi:hypothetical protein